MQSAAIAGLYKPRPIIGSTELDGIFPVSKDFESGKAIAKSMFDLAVLSEPMATLEARSQLPPDWYVSCIKNKFEGLSMGVVDTEK